MGLEKKHKFSLFFYNWISYLGAFLAFFVFFLECFLFAVDFLSHGPNLYLGLITYIALPPFLILGLILIPVGALRKKRRVLKGLAPLEPRPLKIDPSIPSHRNAILVFSIGTFILIAMSLVGVYKGYQYTESVQFCGVLCHQVMHPEFTTYSNSSHARVKCVECHIGEGADWYVRSKLSGTRQVIRTLSKTYPKPIPTPVKNLRPAAETCEQCHWPDKFYGTFDFKRSYFLTEGETPQWNLRMFMNVGGGENGNYGVHKHMNVDRDIYYVADDEKRQKISWIRAVEKDGKETIYTSPGSPYENQAPPADKIRKMDCMDCHNRPTHQYLAPYQLVNEAMLKGDIDRTIPQIKEKAVEVLSKEYETGQKALPAIRESIRQYYQSKHPDFYQSNVQKIDRAVETLSDIFSKNMFPDMKTRWDSHPDNIGHLASQGCFRCHDGEHRAVSGEFITRDCKACHTIVEQGPAGSEEKNLDGLEFRHPVDIGEDWKEANCNDCHTGGA